jgi:putative phosphoribosyl transferase
MRFRNRRDAGRRLADALESYRGRSDIVVLGLARGGVPVAVELARALDLPVDVFAVRKLGAPGQEELAMGAIASGGLRVLNEDVVRALGLELPDIERAIQRETVELERREHAYRRGREPLALTGKKVLLVDDGVATGASMEVAVQAVRSRGAASVVVAVPTGPVATCDRLRSVADAVVCLDTPAGFFAVGQWYEDFRQTSDAEVIASLEQAEPWSHRPSPESGGEHAWR